MSKAGVGWHNLSIQIGRRHRCSKMGRRFMFLAVLCLFGGNFALAAEFRGLWVDAFGPGFFNAAEVKKLASDCRQYNFNAVLVEMRRRGDAFYNPQPPN